MEIILEKKAVYKWMTRFKGQNESADHQHFCEENINTFLDLMKAIDS